MLTFRILSEVCKACAALIYPSSPPRSSVPKDIPWSQFWIPKGPEHRDWPNDDSLVPCMLWSVSSGVLTSHPAGEPYCPVASQRRRQGHHVRRPAHWPFWASANSPVMGKGQSEGHRAAPAERWRAARDPPTPRPINQPHLAVTRVSLQAGTGQPERRPSGLPPCPELCLLMW